jgi:predicted MFS family arabinose efflux permease
VSGSAASYSIGTAIGPAAGGALFDHGGLHLLAVSLCAVAVLAMVASSFAWRADTKETVVSA